MGWLLEECGGRTTEEDGERVVEELRVSWVDDVAALQFPCVREDRMGCSVVAFAFAVGSVSAFGFGFVLVRVGVRYSSGADHSLPDVERIGP